MRLVSLLITLLIMAFIIIQLIGGSGGHNKAQENNAKIAEDKARSVEATILKSAQVQDNTLNSSEGGANSPAFSNLNQQIQQGQQVQGMQQAQVQPGDSGQQQSQ